MSVHELARALRGPFAGTVALDHPLAPLTTYRLGGPAALYVEPATAGDLEVLGRVLAAADRPVPVLPLGRGSNLVVSDEGWPGVVIRMGPAFDWIRPDGPRGLHAGAQTSLPRLANWAARRGLAGAEFTVAIPGSVGGGVRMNAGAHGRQIAECLESATLFDLGELSLDRRTAAALGFEYRRSALTERHLVVDARFVLQPDDPEAVRARMESYRRHRAATQPGALQNAGSVFKNPPGDFAGRLVEATGLKGFAVGGARVSSLHANFFIASDGARSQDVYDLVREVRARVRRRFGVELEPEIRFAGRFETRREVPG